MFFKNKPTNNFNIRCLPHYIWSRTKNRTKNTDQLEPGLKRLTKLTKGTFAESGFTVLNTFAKVYVRKVFQNQNFQIWESLCRWRYNLTENFRYNFRYVDSKKNSKLTKNLWKVSYRMHYSFPNWNFTYSVNFVPDLSNFSESENNSVHITKRFLTLNLMKISF